MNKIDTWRIRCRTRKFEIGSAEPSRSDSECLSNIFCSWIHTVDEVNRLVHHTQPQATGPLNQIRLQQCLHSYSDALAAEYVNGRCWWLHCLVSRYSGIDRVDCGIQHWRPSNSPTRNLKTDPTIFFPSTSWVFPSLTLSIIISSSRHNCSTKPHLPSASSQGEQSLFSHDSIYKSSIYNPQFPPTSLSSTALISLLAPQTPLPYPLPCQRPNPSSLLRTLTPSRSIRTIFSPIPTKVGAEEETDGSPTLNRRSTRPRARRSWNRFTGQIARPWSFPHVSVPEQGSGFCRQQGSSPGAAPRAPLAAAVVDLCQ